MTTDDHKEIISLLIKVHELEIEKLEMQSSCLKKDYEVQRRDVVLSIHVCAKFAWASYLFNSSCPFRNVKSRLTDMS